MADDITKDEVVEEVVPDEPILAEPTKAEEPVESPEPEAEPEVPETVAEPEPEEAPAPSRREQLRIHQLLAKYGQPGERQPAPSQGMDYTKTIDADPEVIQQLEADRQTSGQAQYNAGLRQAEYLNWHTSLKIDAPKVESEFPILNPKSTEFNPAVAAAINGWYTNMAGFNPGDSQRGIPPSVNNPNIEYADFVGGFMELVQETAGQRNAQTVKNVAKQAAATGLRPDGSSAKRLNLNQAPENMTIEELYASIGQTAPKK